MDKLAKALHKARAERDDVLHPAPISTTMHSHPRPQLVPTVSVNEKTLETHRIVAHRTRHAEADIFRILRTQVLQAMQQAGHKTLGITSPNYGDGKTTIALNLALSIALDLKQTVLLADFDLRKPNVLEYLGLNSPVGLTDYFLHDRPIADCLIRPSFDRLTILPAGRALDHSSEVLGSPKIAALAEEMKTRYADRMIIYDMPPILAQDDPLVLMPHVDAVLLVVNQGVTTTQEIRRSMHALGNANVIGTVLNHSRGHRKKGSLGALLGLARR